MKFYGGLLLLLVITAQSCVTSNNNQTYLIKNVNVITMTNSTEVINNASVVVQNEKIVSVNKPFTGKATTINGKGRWLIPGLVDMHVHNLADINFSPHCTMNWNCW
jgi:imidazolonepropionase-like amidohydrolase